MRGSVRTNCMPSEEIVMKMSTDRLGNTKWSVYRYRGADRSLPRPGRKQANVSVRMA